MPSPPDWIESAAGISLFDELPLWSALAGQLLLENVPLRGHRRVLDLGCGTGFPQLELAERLGERARVTGLDPWRLAVGRAAEKLRRWPVANADLVLGDGAAMPFRDGTFDLVVSNLGLHNFADPDAALRECRRVLAPGGVLALATNLTGHMRELYEHLEAVLARRRDPAALERLRAHVAGRGTVESLSARVAAAGLTPGRSVHHEATLRFASGSALLAHHFIRLGFLPAWRAIAGETAADDVLEELRARLDRVAAAAGEVRLTVPLAYLEARAG